MRTAGESDPDAAAALAARLEQFEFVHRRMQQTAHFFAEFAAQMNLIAPRVRQTLELHGVMRFDDLVIRDLFVEERMRQPSDPTGTIPAATGTQYDRRYEYVLLSYRYVGARRHTVVRTLPPEIERLEDMLSLHRIRYDMHVQRNARAQVERARFVIESDVGAGVKFIPDYERASVRVAMRNIDRLATWEFELPVLKLSQPLFEEIARCVLGQPNEFRKLALGERAGTQTTPAVRKDAS